MAIARAAIVTIQFSLAVKNVGFISVLPLRLRSLREINRTATRPAFVFPVPLDHVSCLLLHRLLPACFFVPSVSQPCLAENSPDSLTYPNTVCRRPIWPSSSRCHLIMFRVCFFIGCSPLVSSCPQYPNRVSPKTRRILAPTRKRPAGDPSDLRLPGST